MKKVIMLLVAALMATFATAAYAATLNTETGVGFVGKGEVQTAFNWNNKQLQANAAGVTFTYEVEAQYAQSCMREGEKRTQYHTFKNTRTINATIAYDPRVRNQITGFNLTGFTSTTGGTSAPTDLCNPGNDENNSGWVADPDGEYPEVTQIGAATGGLFVHYGGVSVQLTIVP